MTSPDLPDFKGGRGRENAHQGLVLLLRKVGIASLDLGGGLALELHPVDAGARRFEGFGRSRRLASPGRGHRRCRGSYWYLRRRARRDWLGMPGLVLPRRLPHAATRRSVFLHAFFFVF